MSCATGSCHEIQDLITKASTLFAEAGFTVFNADRFGMKSCKHEYDPYFLQDMIEILKVAQELDTCDCALDTTCSGCSLKVIEQRISTL